MSESIPSWPVPGRGEVPERELWSRPVVWETFEPFVLVDAMSGASAIHRTEVRLAWDTLAIHLHVRCHDPEIWASHIVRDAPLWEEEVVEWFLAAGEEDPRAYAELEWNPLGTLFDAWVDNPDGERGTMRVDRAWSANGLRWAVRVDREEARWTVQARLPWTALGLDGPAMLRTNIYRIERRSGRAPEFQAWSPTFAVPADFHRPERFGMMIPVER